MNFNNCKVAIYGTNNSYFSFNNPVLIKDASSVAINLKNNSTLESPGVSGVSHSSFYITTSERGIQSDSAKFFIENATISDTRYGIVTKNNAFFEFNKGNIDGTRYLNNASQAFGAYVSDTSVGNFFGSSVTGYTGGTGGTQSAMIAVVKNSTLFVESDAKRNIVNIVANGANSQGLVIVDINQGNKINNGSNVYYQIPGGDLGE